MRDVAQAAMPYAKSSPNPISHLTPNRGIGIINSKKSGDFRRRVWRDAHPNPFLFPYLANCLRHDEKLRIEPECGRRSHG